MSLLATPEELKDIRDVESARAWAELPQTTWRSVDQLLGGVPGLRVLASLPKGGVESAVSKAIVPLTPWSSEERSLTAVEMAQVALMWRVARQKFGLPDEDPLNVTSRATPLAFQPVRTKTNRPPAAQKDTWEVQHRPDPQPNDPVVLGFSYAHGAQEFATLLSRGCDCVIEVPVNRWDHASLYDPDQNAGTIYTKHGAFIDGWDDFDGKAFGVSQELQSSLDPQQKQCLNIGADVFARASLTRKVLSSACTGVFVGVMTYDWYEFCVEQSIATMNDQPHMLGNRVSYSLGLQGPSTTVDTACSSSLVAANNAAKAVVREQCDYGLALGVCHMGARKTFVARCAGRLLSKSGRSFSFNASGDGYCRGEGYGGMVFGRREVSKKGCPILASSAVNEDGKSATLVAPNGLAQQELLRLALRAAHLTPAEVACCECAANGSALGDPIEYGAIAKVRMSHESDDTLVLASGKSFKGHTEGASGMTGLVKCALILESGDSAPILHTRQLNADVDDEDTNILIPSESVELFCYGDMKVGVSSFGFGGTNAHAILIEGSGLSHPWID